MVDRKVMAGGFVNFRWVAIALLISTLSIDLKLAHAKDGYRVSDLTALLKDKSGSSVGLSNIPSEIIPHSEPTLNRPSIIGGTPVNSGTINTFALILITDGNLRVTNICGGAIIGRFKILTSAQCAQEAASHYFVYPAFYYHTDSIPSNRLITVARVAPHPKFDSKTLEYDAAVFTLTKEVPSYILPYYPHEGGNTPIHFGGRKFVGATAESIGAGLSGIDPPTLPDTLQIVKVPIRSNLACNISWRNATGLTPIKKSMMCAGSVDNNKGICNGDIGSPLYATGTVPGAYGSVIHIRVIVGIASFGISPCTSNRGTQVFTRVGEIADFIKLESPGSAFYETGTSLGLESVISLLL